jgi:hypothetical protein
MAPCISHVNRRFGGKYHLHLQGRKIRERGTSVSRWLQTAGSSFADLQGDTSKKTAFFIVTSVKISNLTLHILFQIIPNTKCLLKWLLYNTYVLSELGGFLEAYNTWNTLFVLITVGIQCAIQNGNWDRYFWYVKIIRMSLKIHLAHFFAEYYGLWQPNCEVV